MIGKRDWIWSSDANLTTAFRGWVIPTLWLITGYVWAFAVVVACVAALMGVEIRLPVEWLTAWTGFLVLASGVGAYEQKAHRESDYEALRIKAGAAQPTNVTVQSGQANVNTAEGTK